MSWETGSREPSYLERVGIYHLLKPKLSLAQRKAIKHLLETNP